MSKDLELTQIDFAAMLLAPETSIPTRMFSTADDVLRDRVGIYRGNLHAIWCNSLRSAYPVIEQLVGSDFFEQLAILYGRRYPSVSGDLNEFGQYFPSFLQRESSVQAYPYFSEVAQLEWQVHRAYYCADDEVLDLHDFLRLCGPTVTAFGLKLHPAAFLFQSVGAAVQIYLAHQTSDTKLEELDVSSTIPSFALVTRRDWRVSTSEITHAEFVALSALDQGRPLADALELALDLDHQFDVALVLSKWFELGAFSHFYEVCKDSLQQPD
jgi:hypothetical protein